MILIQASARVLPHFVRQVIYNIVYPLGRDWRWLRPWRENETVASSDLCMNSPQWCPYISFKVISENLVVYQDNIHKLMFSFVLNTCLVDNVLTSCEEIRFWRFREFVHYFSAQRIIWKLKIQYQAFLEPGPYLAIALSNSPRNCLREVWYIQFTMLISTIKKYRILPRVATEKMK